ncbi:MAG TPA: hypothetical protein VJ023_05070 [Pyrinomonadaceae bacterium]|nr:hypothetical protein [Pyrinomonadaceae bacterium]
MFRLTRATDSHAMSGLLSFLVISLMMTTIGVHQALAQNKSRRCDQNRHHQRVARNDPTGTRVDLRTLEGAQLYFGPLFNRKRPAKLLMHFHGAPWLIQQHTAEHWPRAALVTVHLGVGSNAYRRPFGRPEMFAELLAEVRKELQLENEFSSILITSFSAGYGAVREILRQPENRRLVQSLLLLDGIHTSYVPERKVLADGRGLDTAGLEPFVVFARESLTGSKKFVLTHSEIFPGTYASTTECIDYLLARLGLKRKPELRIGPLRMQQLSQVKARGFRVIGFAGNTAPDHVDHLHALPAWLKHL